MELREAYDKKQLEKERNELEDQIKNNKQLIDSMEKEKHRFTVDIQNLNKELAIMKGVTDEGDRSREILLRELAR